MGTKQRVAWVAVAAVVGAGVVLLVTGRPIGPNPASSEVGGTLTPSGAPLDLAGQWRVLRIPASGTRPGYDAATTSWEGAVTVRFDPRGGRGLTGARRGDGSFYGRTGCNDTGGVYAQDGPVVVVRRGTVGTTLVGCPGEPDLHTALSDMRGVAAAGADGRLLLDVRGDVLAELERTD